MSNRGTVIGLYRTTECDLQGVTIEVSKAIPDSTAKEWLSVAYVEAIAAQAGLNISNLRWDDGIDLELKSNKGGLFLDNYRIQANVVRLQIKATTDWELRGNQIQFRLRNKNLQDLSEKTWPPIYLVLDTMPDRRFEWIQHDDDCTRFMSRAFFLDLVASPQALSGDEPPPDGKRKISVPCSNLLTAGVMRQLFKNSAEYLRGFMDR
jgi:hypothetical protein